MDNNNILFEMYANNGQLPMAINIPQSLMVQAQVEHLLRQVRIVEVNGLVEMYALTNMGRIVALESTVVGAILALAAYAGIDLRVYIEK